jgi:hypothetical protein
MTKAIKVLYIGGCGRSGSTLLDRMLGQTPGVCSLGELTHLWKALAIDQECGCGTPIRGCDFWRAVGDRAFGGWDAVDLAAMLRLQGTVVRQRYLPLALVPELWPPYRRRLALYGDVLTRLHRGVQEVSGAEVIVDSTKHYSNAFALGLVPGLDFHVVHLVRDSRGVAFSWTKHVKKPEAVHQGASMKRYCPSRGSRRWLGYNAGFELLGRLGIPRTRVRYEDLIRAPRAEIARILARAGFPVGGDELSFIGAHDVDLRPNHTVAGNPMRFRVGTVRLRVDDEWKRELPAADRRLVTLLTWPLLAHYGYVARQRADAPGRGLSACQPQT